MSITSTTILVLGHNNTLLETRRWILEAEGYQTITLTHAREFKHIDGDCHVQLLILCNSLELPCCAQASTLARARWPGIKILDMQTGILMDPGAVVTGEPPVTLDGPLGFLSAVKSLIGEPCHTLHSHIH
jgi:hypothetical protein